MNIVYDSKLCTTRTCILVYIILLFIIYLYAYLCDFFYRFNALYMYTRVTELVLIKLTKFAVALRLRCGSCKLIFLHYFIIFR